MDYTEISVWAPTLYAESVAWHLQEWGLEQLVVSEISAKGPAPDTVAVKVYKPGAVEEHASFVSELSEKLGNYCASGTSLAWVVDPRRREVEVRAADQLPRVLREGDVLDGAPLLPEFSMPVAAVFHGVPRER